MKTTHDGLRCLNCGSSDVHYDTADQVCFVTAVLRSGLSRTSVKAFYSYCRDCYSGEAEFLNVRLVK